MLSFQQEGEMSKIAVTVDFTLKQLDFFQREDRLSLIAIDCFSDYYKNGSKKSVDKMRKRAEELRDAMSKAFENHEERGNAITCHVTWPEDMFQEIKNLRKFGCFGTDNSYEKLNIES